MSLVTTDRIKETCNVVGLNDVTLTGTLTGYKSFSSVMNVGDTCYYSIVDSFDGKWEVGIGTLSNSVTLQRTTVNTSSNNNNKVVFASNVAKIVGLSFTAGQLDTYAGLGSNILTGSQNLQDNELIRAKIRDYSETISSPIISSSTLTLDLQISNIFKVSLNGSITSLVINNPPASGSGGSFTIIFTADGTYRAIDWGAAIKWAGNAVPTLTSTSGKNDVFSFFTSDGGTTWLGFAGGQNF